MRTECMYNNEILHIANFFSIKDGKQIAKEGEIEKLRAYGRSGQLECSCGCGGKVILVAGKKELRRQHFRLKDGQNIICKSHDESPITINAKVVLKCWLDDVLNLQRGQVLFNLPIKNISDIERKYEYTHLVVEKGIGICYERVESNLNDDKIALLSERKGITNLCITDIKNDGCWGQYPEFGIKVQKIQGYYALLSAGEMKPYEEAVLKIVRYEKAYLGTWVQLDVCEDKLSEYEFDDNNSLCLHGNNVYELALKESAEYIAHQEEQLQLAKEKEEAEKRRQKERQDEIERILPEKRELKKKEEEERKQYWEKNQKEQINNNSCTVKKETFIHKKPTEDEVLNQNPKIRILMEYITGLNTIAGVFTYVSKENGSSISKYEVVKIKDVRLNPHRMRLEIRSHCEQRYIIYLKLGKSNIYTQFTWDGYTIFAFDQKLEKDVILKFRQELECNGEKYEEKYLCGLEHECPHKGNDNSCSFIATDNKCSFRSCIKEFISA